MRTRHDHAAISYSRYDRYRSLWSHNYQFRAVQCGIVYYGRYGCVWLTGWLTAKLLLVHASTLILGSESYGRNLWPNSITVWRLLEAWDSVWMYLWIIQTSTYRLTSVSVLLDTVSPERIVVQRNQKTKDVSLAETALGKSLVLLLHAWVRVQFRTRCYKQE
jgi:hypothetical protein